MKGGGSIDKLESGKWRARLMVAGERHSKTFPLRRQAKEWLDQAKADAARGLFIPPDKLRERVGDRLDAWLAEKEAHPTFADSTLVNYKSRVRVDIRPFFGDLMMEQMTAERIRTWQYQLATDKSTAVAGAAMRVLGSFLTAQVADGYLQSHPFDKIRPEDRVKHRPKEMTVLEPHELSAVVEALKDAPCSVPAIKQRYPSEGEPGPYEGFDRIGPGHPEWGLRSGWAADVVLGLAFIGCRVGDLSRLRPQDWDRVNDRLLVRDSKTGNDRRIPVFPAVREVLERSVERGGEYLFMIDGQRGQSQLHHSRFGRNHFKPALLAAGIERNVRVHDLRHFCASVLIRMGFGPVHVAAYLGHSNPSTTMKIYSHMFADDFADMGNALDEMWTRTHQQDDIIPIQRKAR